MKTLIMDLDGTLIDSLPDVGIALNFALQSQGFGQLEPDSVRQLVGGGARPLVEGAIAKVGGDLRNTDSTMDTFIAYYRSHPTAHTTAYPGVLETLEQLVQEDFKLGICTNKPESTTFPVMNALGLNRFFPALRCGDSQPYKKPDARHVFDVINQLGGSTDCAVFIGDSETDILAARNAKIPVIAVSYGYAHKPITELGADLIIDNFVHLCDALRQLDN